MMFPLASGSSPRCGQTTGHDAALIPHERVLAAHFARALPVILPSTDRGRREGRVAAAPGAPAQKGFARARKPRVQAVTTGPPCAVVYGLYALSPVNPSVCHRRPRDAQASSPAWRRTLGRQDHTISPSASMPHVHRHRSVHRIPHHARDDRDTPLLSAAECREANSRLRKNERGIFCGRGLERVNSIEAFREIQLSRTRVWAFFALATDVT